MFFVAGSALNFLDGFLVLVVPIFEICPRLASPGFKHTRPPAHGWPRRLFAISWLIFEYEWYIIMNERMGMEIKKNGEKMSIAVSINSSGQATIPKAVREFLGVVPGENRLIFDFEGKKVVVKREKSRRELFEEAERKIRRINEEAERRNPEIKKLKERYKGMTFNEVRDAYDATPEGRREFKEKYGHEPAI